MLFVGNFVHSRPTPCYLLVNLDMADRLHVICWLLYTWQTDALLLVGSLFMADRHHVIGWLLYKWQTDTMLLLGFVKHGIRTQGYRWCTVKGVTRNTVIGRLLRKGRPLPRSWLGCASCPDNKYVMA